MEIEGYSNYTINENGQVWSKNRNRIMKSRINDGYLQIILCENGKKKAFSIHRLIALEFIPNPNNYPEVDHIDRNPLNNNLSNLRWADRSTQNENKNAYGEIKHKLICYNTINNGKNKNYKIRKKYYFDKSLSCIKWTLHDALDLRTKLLEEFGLDPIPLTE